MHLCNVLRRTSVLVGGATMLCSGQSCLTSTQLSNRARFAGKGINTKPRQVLGMGDQFTLTFVSLIQRAATRVLSVWLDA